MVKQKWRCLTPSHIAGLKKIKLTGVSTLYIASDNLDENVTLMSEGEPLSVKKPQSYGREKFWKSDVTYIVVCLMLGLYIPELGSLNEIRCSKRPQIRHMFNQYQKNWVYKNLQRRMTHASSRTTANWTSTTKTIKRMWLYPVWF